ncbi:MAG: hypothetical protein JW765_11465 [Deltaproteobacteria bacterium]|nr:hypothetical protein [Candidatus Zymogenaceae bacterium]
MNDDHTKKSQRHITTGWLFISACLLLLFAGGLNIFDTLRAGLTPELPALVLCALGAAALILGTLLLIDGWTARWQEELRNRQETGGSTDSGPGALPREEDTSSYPAYAPIGDRRRFAARGTIPGRKSLEEPATKKCPGCGKDVYKDARVCRYCGHAFGVTLRLKVYPPQDKQKREHVVGLLAKKLSMPADEVDHLLEMGMRFRYDSAGKLAAARGKFEALGCRTQAYEKAGRE